MALSSFSEHFLQKIHSYPGISRGQYRGWLIKDQNVRTTVHQFENLTRCCSPTRQILDIGVRVDGQMRTCPKWR
jgi:hypothetical protein